MINYETSNYEPRETCAYFKDTHSNCRNASCGTILTEKVSTVVVIGEKNGVKLTKVSVKTATHFELYIDGSLVYKYYNEKTAKSMFKDFSAV